MRVWPRIAVSSLTQGASMAAFVAQRAEVTRVVLFSSPWANYGRALTLAPWVTHGTGATPAERWFAAWHEREATADSIERAYSALPIPREHIRVFTAEPNGRPTSVNPYPPSVVANGATPRAADGTPLYLEDWHVMLGDVR